MSAPVRTYGERWHGYTPAPRPPRDIELEMEAAGKARDDVALGIAHAKYLAWLTDHGHRQPQLGRHARADEAAR